MKLRSPFQRWYRTRGKPLPVWLLDNETRMLRSIASQLKEGDVVIDLGAHVGNASIEFAQAGAQVFAFEPDPTNFSELRIQASNFPNITIFEKAVSDENGTATLYYEKPKHGKFFKGSTMVQGKPNIGYKNSYEVETISISDVIDGIGKPIKLIKMDIEGAEYIVLSALINSGRIESVEKIYVECHADRIAGLEKAKQDFLKQATKRNYIGKVNFDWR